MPFLIDFLCLGGGGRGRGVFTAQKSAGNHTKRAKINVQQAFIPIHPPEFRTTLPHAFECFLNSFSRADL